MDSEKIKAMSKKIIFIFFTIVILAGAAGYFVFLNNPPLAAGKIIFVSPDDEVYIMNSDGTGVQSLTNNKAVENDLNWSPDGSKIVFRSERDGDSAIYMMNADGSNPKRLSPRPGKDSMPSWSPDGKQIVFSSSRDGQPEIYTMDLDGKSLKQLTFNEGGPNLSEKCKALGDKMTQECQAFKLLGFDVRSLDGAPTWSPDGKKIAFWSARDGGDFDIFIMDAGGNNQTQLTFNDAPDGEMFFSPDGQSIYFARGVNGNAQIFVMNVDGSNQRQLTHFSGGAAAGDMSLSPDGQKIVFQKNIGGDRAEVWVMNSDGSNPQSLNQECNIKYCSPRWQPVR